MFAWKVVFASLHLLFCFGVINFGLALLQNRNSIEEGNIEGLSSLQNNLLKFAFSLSGLVTLYIFHFIILKQVIE